MTTPAKRASVKAWHAKRTATGDRKVTVWLTIRAREKLAELARESGVSKDAAAERAIMMAPTEDDIERAPFLEDEE